MQLIRPLKFTQTVRHYYRSDMITTEKRYFSNIEINSINDFIAKSNKIVGERFKVYTLIGLLFIDFLILFLIYLFEDYMFSIIFKLLLFVPIWAIIMITFRYFQKRRGT